MQPRRILEVLLGGYLALLVLPAVALSGPWPVTSDRLPVLLGGGVLFALVIALGARSVTELPARVTALPAAVLAVGLPLLYLPVLLFLTPAESLAALVAVTGLLAVLPGLGLPVGGTVI